MSFPNTNRKALIAFWAVVFVVMILFGITFAWVNELGIGSHSFLTFAHRYLNGDVNIIRMLIRLIAYAVVGFVAFGAWMSATVIVFLLFSCFDRDLIEHIWSPLIPGAVWRNEYTRPEMKDILWKGMVFGVFSGAVGMVLLLLIFDAYQII